MEANQNPDIAYYDSFLGLSSYLAFQEEMKRVLELSKRRKTLFAILHLNLELVNKSNEFLKEVSKKLSGCMRKSDIIVRFKENEFLIVLLDIANNKNADIVSNKILEEFKKPIL